MTQHDHDDTASIGEIERLCGEIGGLIAGLREARHMGQVQLARAGDNVRQIVKLSTQRLTANEILGFHETSEREAFRGIMEAGLQSCGLSLEQTPTLAEAALEVLDSPEIHKRGVTTRDAARTLAIDVIHQFFEQNRG